MQWEGALLTNIQYCGSIENWESKLGHQQWTGDHNFNETIISYFPRKIKWIFLWHVSLYIEIMHSKTQVGVLCHA